MMMMMMMIQWKIVAQICLGVDDDDNDANHDDDDDDDDDLVEDSGMDLLGSSTVDGLPGFLHPRVPLLARAKRYQTEGFTEKA